MQIRFHPRNIRRIRWYEFAIRFVFGGLATVMAGVIAQKFGPGVGGLFLAFPAIFPASVTLVEKHEKQKKHAQGLHGTRRGRETAALDAFGGSLGSIALALFALVVWLLLSRHSALLVVSAAGFAWLGTSLMLWRFRHRFHLTRQHRSHHLPRP